MIIVAEIGTAVRSGSTATARAPKRRAISAPYASDENTTSGPSSRGQRALKRAIHRSPELLVVEVGLEVVADLDDGRHRDAARPATRPAARRAPPRRPGCSRTRRADRPAPAASSMRCEWPRWGGQNRPTIRPVVSYPPPSPAPRPSASEAEGRRPAVGRRAHRDELGLRRGAQLAGPTRRRGTPAPRRRPAG